MQKKEFLFKLFSVVVFLLLNNLALAQVGAMATLSGVITDPSGAFIPNAQVTLVNEESGMTRRATFDNSSNGGFSFPQIEPGHYEIHVEAAGFKTLVRKGLVVTTGVVNSVSLQMELGEVSQNVTVTAGTQVINTTDATLSGLVDEKRVQDLPLNARSFANLVTIQPGVAPGGIFTGESSANVDAGGFIAGQRSFDHNYTVDGGNIMSPTWPQPVWAITTNGGISVDAIREFQIVSSNKGPEAGGKSGALIQVTTKSGTNEWHADGFEFLRNNVLDARNFFDVDKKPFRQNQFGGSGGGPISRRRGVFVFGNYEGFRRRLTGTITPVSPTPLLLSQIPGGPNHGFLREIFENTFLPPRPGTFGSNDLVAPVVSSTNLKNDRDMWLARVDANLPHNTTGTFRAMGLNGSSGFGVVFATGVPGGDIGQAWEAENFLMRFTTVISPTKVNEFHFSWDRSTTAFPGAPTPPGLVKLGFAPTPNDLKTATKALPTIISLGTGLSIVGPLAFVPRPRSENTFEWADNFSWVHGNHSLAFGGQLLRSQANEIRTQNIRPQTLFLGFGPPFDNSPFGLTTGNIFSQTENFPVNPATLERGLRFTEVSFYGHDNYKVRPNLTVDLGIRWVYDSPLNESNGFFNNIFRADASGKPIEDGNVGNADAANIVLAPIGPGTGRLNFSEKRFNNWGPSVGVSWSPFKNNKTVVSAGYSLTYERPFFEAVSDIRFNPPFVISTAISNVPFGTIADPFSSAAQTPNVLGFNPDAVIPRIQYWNFSVQQELTSSTLLRVSYLGSRGSHLFQIRELNEGPGFQGRRPNPKFGEVTLNDTDGKSLYNALEVVLNHRYSHGLTVQGSWTYSKSLDTSSGSITAFGNQNFPTEQNNRFVDYGPSDFDFKHLFVVSYVYELPVGKGHSFLSCFAGALCKVVSGWEMSGITSIRTGQRFSLLSGLDNNGDGVANDRARQIASSLNGLFSTSDKTQFLNPGAVGTLISATQGVPLGRNTFTTPHSTNFDFSLIKQTALTERLKLQTFAEFFNIFNNVNLGVPVNTVNSPAFGKILATSGDQREIQFGMRISF